MVAFARAVRADPARRSRPSRGRRSATCEVLGPTVSGRSVVAGVERRRTRGVPRATLVALFDAQVARTPDAAAVVFEGAVLTYGEFDARVNRLARYLIARGVGPESLVACGDAAVARFGGGDVCGGEGGWCVRAGRSGSAGRAHRVRAGDGATGVCADHVAAIGSALPRTSAVVAIDGLDLSGFSGAPVTDADRLRPLRPANTAYVIFTSGSTGRPKGVAVSHAGDRESVGVDAGGVRADGRGCGVAEDADDVRRVGVGVVLAVAGGCAVGDGARRTVIGIRSIWRELIDEQRVTATHFVPSMLDGVRRRAAVGGVLGSLRACVRHR